MNLEKKSTTFPRIVPLLAGVIIQLCLGTVYIWGVFQQPVMDLFKWDKTTASLTFSIVLGFFVLGSIIGGRIQDKTSPRVAIISGGVILGIGTFLASFTPADNPFFLYFTYGMLGGFGMGMTYTTIIACCQKWYRDRMGLATGIVVGSLGFGGVIFTPSCQILSFKCRRTEYFYLFRYYFYRGMHRRFFLYERPAQGLFAQRLYAPCRKSCFCRLFGRADGKNILLLRHYHLFAFGGSRLFHHFPIDRDHRVRSADCLKAWRRLWLL